MVVGNGWEPDGLPDGVQDRAPGRRTPASRAGATRACRAVAGELLFFLDDDARLPGTDALARVAARFAVEPDVGLLQLRVAPSTPGRAAARLGAAAAGRRPGALERRHRGLGGRGGDAARGLRAGRRLAGRVPLRPRGRSTSPGACSTRAGACSTPATSRPLHPSTRPRRTTTPPTTARATASGSRAATCRCPLGRALRARRSPLRTLPLLARSRAQAARGGARLPRRAARPVRPPQAAACEDAVADDAGRTASGHLAASLSVPVTSAPAPAARRARARGGRVHLRAPRLRAAQDRPPAAAARTCASCGAGASSRARCRAPTCARSTSTRSSGSCGWCSTRCCWRASTSCWSTSCAAGLARRRTSSRTCWPGCSPTTSSRTRSGCR